MVHELVVQVVRPIAQRLDIPVTGDWVLLLFVIPASYAIFYMVERPLDQWRQAFVRRREEQAERPSAEAHSSTLRSASRPERF